MIINIQFPKIEVFINNTEFGTTYNLYVNEDYEGTYCTKSDLMFRIGLIHATKVNEVLGHENTYT